MIELSRQSKPQDKSGDLGPTPDEEAFVVAREQVIQRANLSITFAEMGTQSILARL